MSEEKKEQGISSTEFINIKVKSQDGNEIFFKLKKNTKLRKVFNSYCTRLGTSQRYIRFYFDGNRLSPNSTPEQLEMEDYDMIETFLEAEGGCH